MKRSNTLVAGIVVVLISFIACTDDMRVAFYLEDFETVCDGTPCGWERVRGETDQAIWIETIHPGEHALQLSGEDVLVRGPANEPRETPASTFDLVMAVAARCDLGSAIEIDVVVVDEFGGTWVAHTTPFTDVEWTGSINETLVFDGSPSSFVTRVEAIAIHKIGSGTCEVSSIAIDELDVVPGC